MALCRLFPLIFLLLMRICTSTMSIVVQTSKGPIQGYMSDLGSNQSAFHHGKAIVFQGIPFAEPPVGNLRLREPAEKKNWIQPIMADKYENGCSQPSQTNGSADPNPLEKREGYSEDCLYLNVFTPSTLHQSYLCVVQLAGNPPFPVMVWIHGGALSEGSAANYDPRAIITQFVDRGVIFVSIQYRLGILGFFTTKDTEFPANIGLLDSLMALRWVKTEIERFGGDPNRITIFGESAGGCIVSTLTYSPIAKGVFNQAIMQSGTTQLCLDGRDYFHEQSFQVAQKLCGFTETDWVSADRDPRLRQCLAEKSVEDILEKQSEIGMMWYLTAHPSSDIYPDWPRNLAKQRTNIPVILGTNRDELSFLPLLSIYNNQTSLEDNNQGSYATALKQQTPVNMFGNKTAIVRKVVDGVYRRSAIPPFASTDYHRWMKAAVDMKSDYLFSATTMSEVDWWIRETKNPNVFLYSFEYEGDRFSKFYLSKYKGVFHAADLFYLFKKAASSDQISSPDQQMMDKLSMLWTNFAINGRPTEPNDPDVVWQSVSAAKPDNHLQIVNPTALSMRDGFHADGVKLWNDVVPAIIDADGPTQPPTVSTVSAATTTTTAPTPSTTATDGGVTTTTDMNTATTTTTSPATVTPTTVTDGNSTTSTTSSDIVITTTPSTTTHPDKCCLAANITPSNLVVLFVTFLTFVRW